MKKIILILLSALMAVSLVSGYLGEELVTCGGFFEECGVDWENLYWGDINDEWYDEFDETSEYYYIWVGGVNTFQPLNQTFLSVEIGRSYNVSINHTSCKTDGLIVELGGVNTSVTDTTTFANPIVNSFIVNPINTKGIVIYANTEPRTCNIQRVLSISVKEIIEPPKGCIVQLRKAKDTIATQEGIIQKLTRDKEAIQNGIKGVIVQLRKLLRI